MFVQGWSIANTNENKTIIGETIKETLQNLNFTYVGRHDNFSSALFRTVAGINEFMT